MKKVLLLIALTIFPCVLMADSLCVKQTIKPNPRGKIKLANAIRVLPGPTCPARFSKILDTELFKGDAGAAGKDGQDGVAGADGEVGATGEAGIDGVDGVNGADGVTPDSSLFAFLTVGGDCTVIREGGPEITSINCSRNDFFISGGQMNTGFLLRLNGNFSDLTEFDNSVNRAKITVITGVTESANQQAFFTRMRVSSASATEIDLEFQSEGYSPTSADKIHLSLLK